MLVMVIRLVYLLYLHSTADLFAHFSPFVEVFTVSSHMFRKNNKNQYSNCPDTNSSRGAALCKLLFLIANTLLVQNTGVLQIVRIKSWFGVLK